MCWQGTGKAARAATDQEVSLLQEKPLWRDPVGSPFLSSTGTHSCHLPDLRCDRPSSSARSGWEEWRPKKEGLPALGTDRAALQRERPRPQGHKGALHVARSQEALHVRLGLPLCTPTPGCPAGGLGPRKLPVRVTSCSVCSGMKTVLNH